MKTAMKRALTMLFCVGVLAGCVHNPDRLATGKNMGNRPLDDVVRDAADQALNTHNYAEATGYLALLHHQSPDDEALAVRYATALRRTGEPDKALAVLKKFADPETASSAVLVERARILLQAGRPADALQNARWAIDGNPKYGDGYDVLGIALDSLNKPDEAEQAFQTALANKTSEPERVLNNLGMSHARRGNLVEAEKLLDQASRLSNQAPMIQNNLNLVRTLRDQQKMAGPNARHFPTYSTGTPEVPGQNPLHLSPTLASQYPDRIHANREPDRDVILLPVSNNPAYQAESSDQTINIMVPAGVMVDMAMLAETLNRHVSDIQMVADPKASRLVLSLKEKTSAICQKVNGRWIVAISPSKGQPQHVSSQHSSLAQPVMNVEREAMIQDQAASAARAGN